MSTPAPPRYQITFRNRETAAHGFHDAATPADALAWLATMLEVAPPTKDKAPQPSKKTGELPAPVPAQGTAREPDPNTLAGKILAMLRKDGPMHLDHLKTLLDREHGSSSVRGRLSELVAAGHVLRDGHVYRAASPAPTPARVAVKSAPVRAAPSPPPARQRTR